MTQTQMKRRPPSFKEGGRTGGPQVHPGLADIGLVHARGVLPRVKLSSKRCSALRPDEELHLKFTEIHYDGICLSL